MVPFFCATQKPAGSFLVITAIDLFRQAALSHRRRVFGLIALFFLSQIAPTLLRPVAYF
jgi:hypothetical protein